jgi:hypothetical protein
VSLAHARERSRLGRSGYLDSPVKMPLGKKYRTPRRKRKALQIRLKHRYRELDAILGGTG